MGDDSFFKKRFVWIDISDNTFHWCKVQDRSSPHKLLKMSRVVSCRTGPPLYSSFLEGRHATELCWSLECESGRTIDIKVSKRAIARPAFSPHLSSSLQMADAGKVAEWVHVVEVLLHQTHTSGNGSTEIEPVNIAT
jgi:hypothetical protein